MGCIFLQNFPRPMTRKLMFRGRINGTDFLYHYAEFSGVEISRAAEGEKVQFLFAFSVHTFKR